MEATPQDLQRLGLLFYSDRCDEIRAALMDVIKAKNADRHITLYAHDSQSSPGLPSTEVPPDWSLDFVGGPEAEPFGYYCDVTASPRPRQAVNEKTPSGAIRLKREWANMRDGVRYDPPSATLGAELYHKDLHKKKYGVHISEAVFEQLVAEARAALKSRASPANLDNFVKDLIAANKAEGRRPNMNRTVEAVEAEFGKGNFDRSKARQAHNKYAGHQRRGRPRK